MKTDLKEGCFSQEGLKILACVTMLIDHIGAAIFPFCTWLRLIGRIAFPVFCYLLVEGAWRTRHPGKYALRLAVGCLLAELPFDYALFGGFTWRFQSVMVTLLLGYGALVIMRRVRNPILQLLAIIPFAWAAEVCSTDYGSAGVILIGMLGLCRNLTKGRLLAEAAVIAVVCCTMSSAMLTIGSFRISYEAFAVFSILPIALYSGKKLTHSPAVQWGFYLFYPVHLSVLYLIRSFM